MNQEPLYASRPDESRGRRPAPVILKGGPPGPQMFGKSVAVTVFFGISLSHRNKRKRKLRLTSWCNQTNP